MNRKLFMAICTVVVCLNCKPAILNNSCDLKSENFTPQLFLSAALESNFCGLDIVNSGNLYRYTDFTFYLTVPASISPRAGNLAGVSLVPNLPNGLYIDAASGSILGTPTAPSSRQFYSVLRKGVSVGQISIEVKSLVASFVYGQFGNLNCGVINNGGGCTPAAPVNASNLSSPSHVVTDTNGGVYISSGNRILYYSKDQTTASRVYGQHGSFTCDALNATSDQLCNLNGSPLAGTLASPKGMLIDGTENLIVADSGTSNRRILIFPKESNTPVRVIGAPDFVSSGGGATSQNRMNQPNGLSLDSSGGFYVSDSLDSRVIYFPKDSATPTEVYGKPNFDNNGAGLGVSNLSVNQGVVADSTGGIYIADTNNNRVVYYPKGSTSATRVYGQPDLNTNNLSQTSINGMNAPAGVGLDQSENLYVAELNNHRVLIYPKTDLTSGMSAISVIGQFGSFTCGNENNTGACGIGTATAQNLYRPSHVHFDRQGKMYIVDSSNNRVLAY